MADFVTTLHYPLRPEWNRRGVTLTADQPPAHVLARRLLTARSPCVVLNGFSRVDLAAAAALARRRHPPHVIITDCTWGTGQSAADRTVTRLAVRALDGPHVTYCVLSEAERQQFPATWGVDPSRVRCVPWYHGLSDEQLRTDVGTDGPIFSGGRSLRNYALLAEAARQLPFAVTAAAPRSMFGDAPLPPNLEVSEVTPARYFELLRDARLVVLPLEHREDRTAGQTTLLDAMALGKLVIVTETIGISEYVEDGVTGRVVPAGNADALREVIQWAMDPGRAGTVKRIAQQARHVARTRFAPERYVEALLELTTERA